MATNVTNQTSFVYGLSLIDAILRMKDVNEK